jgi:hypothetical protein
VKVSSAVVVPPGVVTAISRAPPPVTPSGIWQVRLLLLRVALVHSTPPMVTVAVPLTSTRSVPVMVRGPPSRSPVLGVTPVMVGGLR